jgi:hypothetical protein
LVLRAHKATKGTSDLLGYKVIRVGRASLVQGSKEVREPAHKVLKEHKDSKDLVQVGGPTLTHW